MRAADREARRIVSRDQILLKAGIVAMSVAIALTIAAVAVAATLTEEPERAIAAEPAANVTREPPIRPDLPVKPRVENAERLQRLPTVEAARAAPKPSRRASGRWQERVAEASSRPAALPDRISRP